MKTEITEKQRIEFNRMKSALHQIAKNYQTPDQIRKDCERQYGLDYGEALEMSYENIQLEAKIAIKGVSSI